MNLTPDKIACIRDMKQEVQQISRYLRNEDVGVVIVPKLDVLMAGLDALLEPTHEEQAAQREGMDA